ncbi:MAG: gamma-glutamyltransferase [Firmicutes bacterium]|nr:gamma-glutamyltransferase [Bacillota bacterium]
MVATAHPLATLAGVEVLRAGGNAVDAAIAAAGVAAVVLPHMCGPGGDAFLLIYEAERRRVTAISGAGPAPRGASPEVYRQRGYRTMPLEGILSVAVPGAVDAWARAVALAGSRPLEELLEPAVAYAEDGFVVGPELADEIRSSQDKLRADPAAREVFLAGGRPPRVGEVLRQPDLGRSLRRLGRDPDDLYRGDLARRIVSCAQAAGGLFTPEDLASYRSEVGEPLRTDYRGATVCQTTFPSQGFILLEALNILEGFDLAGTDRAAAIHLMVEAKKLAFEDRLRFAGDPRHVPFPLERLISKEYAVRRRLRIDGGRAQPGWYPPAGAGHGAGDTTYLAVVDGRGNAVSLIQSLSLAFGSGVMVPGTGILLNNRAGRGFTLLDGHPNCVAPGKRTVHTLNCYMVFREGELWLVGGTPGGDGQPQWNLQVLVSMIDWGLDPASAVEWPRWTSHPGTDPAHWGEPEELRVENRLPADITAELERRGHRLRLLGPWAGGGAVQLIARDPATGVLTGVSDPRAEGLALPL